MFDWNWKQQTRANDAQAWFWHLYKTRNQRFILNQILSCLAILGNNLSRLIIIIIIVIYSKLLPHPVYLYQLHSQSTKLHFLCDHTLLPNEELIGHPNQLYKNNTKYLLINELILIYKYKLYYITLSCILISAPLSIRRDMADLWPLDTAQWRAV